MLLRVTFFTTNITNIGVASLASLSALNKTAFDESRGDHKCGMQHVASFTSPTKFSLRSFHFISDEGARAFRKLMALRDLSLWSCKKSQMSTGST